MRRYVLWRLAQAVGVLWAAYTLTFLLLDLLPGDPVAAMAGAGLNATQVTPERLAELRTEYGFDRPFLVRYATSLGDALRGTSATRSPPAAPWPATLAEALPQTLQLAAVALPLAVLVEAAGWPWRPPRRGGAGCANSCCRCRRSGSRCPRSGSA